jgi:predicted RNA-binding protein YlxR (DUF448 family)
MKGKQKGPRPKHIPQRTCVACRRVNAKRGLVRIVRTPEGSVVVDETGKRAGRGAYLCRVRDCWELALQKKALEYALKTAISLEDKAALAAFGAGLPPRQESDYDLPADDAARVGWDSAPALDGAGIAGGEAEA